MRKIREIIVSHEGAISVEGDTDNVSIRTSQYRSNWDLSLKRASAVDSELFIDNLLDQRQFSVTGFADTRPLVPNNTAANRTKNRRVEIIIRLELELDPEDEINALRGEDAELYNRLNLVDRSNLFNVPPRGDFLTS